MQKIVQLVIENRTQLFNHDELLDFLAGYFIKNPFQTNLNELLSNIFAQTDYNRSQLLKNNLKVPAIGKERFLNAREIRQIYVGLIPPESGCSITKIGVEDLHQKHYVKLSTRDLAVPSFATCPLRNMEHVVARLDKPKVYIGTHGLALITKDGLYVDGVCNGDGLMYAQAGVEKCAPAQKLPGTTIFLCHTWSNGYFHWVLEALPRLVLIEKSGYAIKNVDRILVRQKNQTVVESLALFGIESNKIIEAPVNCLLEPDWTFFTDSLENYDFSKNPTSIPIELWIPNELSKRLVQPQIMSSKRSAFYIDRSKALVRKVVNDDAILSRLKSHEIEIIRLEDFSFTDKFSLMASANFLVGPSGAGFANLAFATEGSNALIFYGQGFESDSFFSICAAKDLNHSHLVCERVLSDSSQPIGTINDDIVVDVRKFDECIEQLKQCAQ